MDIRAYLILRPQDTKMSMLQQHIQQRLYGLFRCVMCRERDWQKTSQFCGTTPHSFTDSFSQQSARQTPHSRLIQKSLLSGR